MDRRITLKGLLIAGIMIFFIVHCNQYDLAEALECPECALKKATGCTSCRIFVSAGTTKGNMLGSCDGGTAVCGVGATGISKADYICQNDSARPDPTKTYKALISDSANRIACSSANCGLGLPGRVDWVLSANTPYYKKDGTTLLFTTNENGIFVFGTMSNFIDNTVAYDVWTGLSPDWTVETNHCSSWASTANFGMNGISSLSDSWSISDTTTMACSSPLNLYCVEQ